jgi:hypothetical protein
VYIPWQMLQDISRSKLEDTERAVKYAYHAAESPRRPKRRIAGLVRLMSEWLSDAVPRRAVYRRRTATHTPTADIGGPDLLLTVIAIDGLEDLPIDTVQFFRQDRPSRPAASAISGSPGIDRRH